MGLMLRQTRARGSLGSIRKFGDLGLLDVGAAA
jgi:hypothetical protein